VIELSDGFMSILSSTPSYRTCDFEIKDKKLPGWGIESMMPLLLLLSPWQRKWKFTVSAKLKSIRKVFGIWTVS